jgi:hypothetical protein
MSVHFDFAVALDLKPDVPAEVVETLRYVTRPADYAFSKGFENS